MYENSFKSVRINIKKLFKLYHVLKGGKLKKGVSLIKKYNNCLKISSLKVVCVVLKLYMLKLFEVVSLKGFKNQAVKKLNCKEIKL